MRIYTGPGPRDFLITNSAHIVHNFNAGLAVCVQVLFFGQLMGLLHVLPEAGGKCAMTNDAGPLAAVVPGQAG